MGEEQMNANRARLRLMETEAYCQELEGKNKTLHEQLEIERAARKSAEMAQRMAYIAAGAVIFVCYLMSFAQYMAI